MFCCLRNFVLLYFIECFKLLVSQKNNVCGVGVGGGGVRECVRACVCVCVCTLLLLSIFLVFERFLAPCFIELLMFYC